MDNTVVVDVSESRRLDGVTEVGNIHLLDGSTLVAHELEVAGDVYVSAGATLDAPNLNANSVTVSPNGGQVL